MPVQEYKQLKTHEMPSIFDNKLPLVIRCVTLVCLLLPVSAPLLSAQTNVADVDSLYVYDFEEQSFRSYPVAREVLYPEGVIGESKYGILNNEIIGDFDEFLDADTTILHRVADFFDPADYPFSAAVKLFRQKGDTLVQRCSGLMISDYWVATANHCFEIRRTHHNNWSTDSIATIFVSPSFHNGTVHPDIGTVAIDKAVFLAGSSFHPDVIFLRLTQPAGRWTGSVAMRSTVTGDIDEDQTALTFGYPGRYLNYILQPDEFDNIYNGDTLYFSQNAVRAVSERAITIHGHLNPGQSGSPILFFRHGIWFTYGVLERTMRNISFFGSLGEELSHNIRELMSEIDDTSLAGIGDPHTITSLHLKQNYPNPFNANTRIVYKIPQQSHVRLDIFDLLGRRVATLTNEMQSAGRYEVTFDAGTLSSGVYLYRLQAGDATQTRKMTLVK